MAGWIHNTNVDIHEYNPLKLATGKSVSFSGVSTGIIVKDIIFREAFFYTLYNCMTTLSEKYYVKAIF